jgi:stage III sporulation protein AH
MEAEYMKSAKSKRQLTLLSLMVALGVAVYLNWEYAKADSTFTLDDATAVSAAVSWESETQAEPVLEALPDKNYGDAQLVSTQTSSSDKYFEEARLNRTKTRDEALDTLQKSLKAADLTQEEKAALTQSLSAVIESITVESDIESRVKAKGFADCVAFIDGDRLSLAVKTGSEGLTKSEVAQLRDIILGKMEIQAKDISIVEVK